MAPWTESAWPSVNKKTSEERRSGQSSGQSNFAIEEIAKAYKYKQTNFAVTDSTNSHLPNVSYVLDQRGHEELSGEVAL